MIESLYTESMRPLRGSYFVFLLGIIAVSNFSLGENHNYYEHEIDIDEESNFIIVDDYPEEMATPEADSKDEWDLVSAEDRDLIPFSPCDENEELAACRILKRRAIKDNSNLRTRLRDKGLLK